MAQETDHPEVTAHNTRLGLVLFLIYILLYGGFMGITALRHDLMATTLGGVNLAIVYGMGLIFGALVLAVVYMLLCRTQPSK